MLLDGQQRATAIALAFYDIWSGCDDQAKGALWVDLSTPPKNRPLEFVFRVLTRAHPWGYRRNNPQETLSSSAIRAALCAYQAAHNSLLSKPSDIALWKTWPWDADAPLPVAPMIQAVLAHPNAIEAACTSLRNNLGSLPLFSKEEKFSDEDNKLVRDAQNTFKAQQKVLQEAFDCPTSPSYEQLRRIMGAFNTISFGQRRYRVPALTVDIEQVGDDGPHRSTSAEDAKDAIELLFIRLNAAGTPLAGEELVYSLIKAQWPDVAKWMQNLPNLPALPSRIAAMCVRLVLARHGRRPGDGNATMPSMPGVSEFRNLLKGNNPNHTDFGGQLKEFLDTNAADLLTKAWNFLALPPKEANGKIERAFRLLPAQAVDIAQHSPDVFLLLMRWLDRLNAVKIGVEQISESVHRRTLGFLTAIAWFAPNKSKACAAIWKSLDEDVNEKQLLDRFNQTRFKAACQLSERSDINMIPLPAPNVVFDLCNRFLREDGRTKQTQDKATVNFPKGSFWTDKDWWYDQFSPLLEKSNRDMYNGWRNTANTTNNEEDLEDTDSLVKRAAVHFLDTLWGGKSTVLTYAQRAELHNWYQDYDPSLPEMMDDKNRPWDFDHILPQSFFSGKWSIPQSVKDWCNSIGNLRAWPLEANRADGNVAPRKKLSVQIAEESNYGINSKSILGASFISVDEWPHWLEAVPVRNEAGEVKDNRYLSNNCTENYSDQRIATITAIMMRFAKLYEHWHEELRLGGLW
ncbi:hypothetical protein GCM10010909_33300 [Acidocella aquatica]|uniref:GmrSD restriction endonucleases C-terminal domain-containing protein n=1 Tax=Acidocella aquatica TaxID=1922313 RepID=A0ABQ6AAQ6_9PROT|nr:hypothetical protein GCM10010909_33300 [Acidocella aquatica]